MKKTQKVKMNIPTYTVGEAESLPVYFEKRPYQGASGKVYPIPYSASISDDKKDKEYDAIVLENEYVKVVCLPEIGGKIHSILDKTNGYDAIYNNKVIKPAMVGLAGPWVAGGIEFNFPQHHRPTTFIASDSSIGKDGSVFMGEFDYFYGMKGMLRLTLGEGSSLLCAEITVYNATAEKHPFMWWANMAVEIDEDYKIVFPPDVEYVNDHDRRAVLSWPKAKGVYHTARPYDYGDGTDIHVFSAVRVPSSFMVAKGQSEGEFVSGWDENKHAGVVTVSNHHIAPGKKLWTWGDGRFGAKWCGNLTDDGSRYVELMTGCYTDNQPDFTWIAPYETKKFKQYWYPIRDIGEVKCASEEGAVNLEKRDGGVFVGFYSVKSRRCTLTLACDGKTLWQQDADVSPAAPFTAMIDSAEILQHLTLTVTENGSEIISYTPPVRGNKKPITPRLPAARPQDIASLEELYINGLHLLQYKHFAYRAEDYFSEALKRDEGDIRCNEAMGDIALAAGKYDEAKNYFSKAMERLTLRNANPYDTEVYYKTALCDFYEGNLSAAYDNAYLAIWSYPMRSAGYYLLAKIEARRGNISQAIDFLGLSLETNAGHLWAEYVRMILRGEDADRLIAEKDPLFLPNGSERRCVEFASELASFGLYRRAIEVLNRARDGAIKYYYLAEYCGELGEKEKRVGYIARADACAWEREFPSTRESIPVFLHAGTARAYYYLGLVLYGFERYEEACAAFEECVKRKAFAPAYRCLALGYFDHLKKAKEAREALEKAFALMPESDRIFYELTSLYKSLNLPLSERLAFYESNLALTKKRDDCTLQYCVLLTEQGDTEKAKRILSEHRFHTYEGGEGYLTQHHAWLHFLVGSALLKDGKTREAIAELESGLTFPLNYGEEKNYFVNEAPIYQTLACCYAALQMRDKEAEALRLAVSTKGAPTVHSYWQCIAYRMRGDERAANALAEEMISLGEARLANADVNDYYGVGAPAYAPFCYDIVRAHTLQGSCLKGFGCLAKGDRAEAEKALAVAEKIDNADFSVYLLRKFLYD